MEIKKFNEYLQRSNLSFKTRRIYIFYINRYLCEQNFKIKKMNDFKNFFAIISQKFSSNTKRLILSIFEKYFEYKKIYWDKSFRKKLRIKNKIKIFDILTKNEIRKLCLNQNEKNQYIKLRNSIIIEFLYYSGIRVSELCNLKWIDINGDIVQILGKGNKTREIIIPRILIIRLNLLKYNKYIFETRNQTRITPNDVNKIIKKRAQWAKINKNISAHTFRRSFCTNLIKSGANIKIVSLLMGHSKIETTSRYIIFTKKEIMKEYRKFLN